MGINIGNNNKIVDSNVGNNNVNIKKKFYQKEGFWTGVFTGVLSSLISSGIIFAITKIIEFFS